MAKSRQRFLQENSSIDDCTVLNIPLNTFNTPKTKFQHQVSYTKRITLPLMGPII